ncbi:MAG: type II secretion system protein N [Lautropia sp.]|nr:type II secretion system protein N [Lautropia sp.]
MRSSSVAPRLLSLLLFLLLIGCATYWSMQLLAPRGAIAPNDAIGDNSRPPLPIASRLFGARNTEAVETAPPPIDVKVLGVLQAGARGVAVLGINEKPMAAYAVNQKLGGGSILKAVYDDKVIIEHNGRRIEFPAPARYSVDILTSNAGHSQLPQGMPEGIEAADGQEGNMIREGVPSETPILPAAADGSAPQQAAPDMATNSKPGTTDGAAAGAHPLSPSPGMMRPGLDMEDNGGDLPYGGDASNLQDGVSPEASDTLSGGEADLQSLSPEERAAAINALQQAGSGMPAGARNGLSDSPGERTNEQQQSIEQDLNR